MKNLVRLSVFVLPLFFQHLAFADMTLYTDRPTDQLKPAAEEFTRRTGEKLTIVELPYSKLLARLQAEGSSSPADLIFVKDMIYLGELSELGFFQPMKAPSVAANLEASMRDPRDLWAAVTFRARTMVYDPTKINPNDIQNYEDLADMKWAGQLCLRKGEDSYNVALVSSLIEHLGYQKAKETVQGMVENLAFSVRKDDNQVIETIATGSCAVGVVNSYYLAGFYAENPNFPVKISFLNQNTTGTHVNGTGIGIAATSKKPEIAEKFISLLLEDQFQLQLSSAHLDFPAKKGLAPSTFVKSWSFKKDLTNWSKIAAHAAEARRLMKEVAYQ